MNKKDTTYVITSEEHGKIGQWARPRKIVRCGRFQVQHRHLRLIPIVQNRPKMSPEFSHRKLIVNSNSQTTNSKFTNRVQRVL